MLVVHLQVLVIALLLPRQNSTMEAYLWAFVNFEQNDWARLLPMAEFAYNNANNASSGHTPFELNCGYHPRMSHEENVDPRSKSKSADELSAELRELMIVCRDEEIVFHVSLLEQDTTRKGRVDENATELDAGDESGEYEVEAIRNSAVYARESAGHLPGFYYLVS